MDSATILPRSPRRRELLLGLALGLLIFDSGCSHLQGFRGSRLTAFGFPAESANGTGSLQSVDLYTQRFRDAQSPALVARNERAPRAADSANPRDGSNLALADPTASNPRDGQPRSMVRLQAPVPLVPASEAAPAIASSRSAGGWVSSDAVRPNSAAGANSALNRGRVAFEPARREQPGPTVESLLTETRMKLAGISSYQVALNRQEMVGSGLLPAEDVLLSIRRNPKAVRLEWPSGPHKGREVIYSATENNGQMHLNLVDSISPMKRFSMAPDNPMVMANSRHPITEAGFDTIVADIEQAMSKAKAGDISGGTVRYAGLEQAPGLPKACHKLSRVTSKGESWLVYLDPDTKLPAMVQATGPKGELLERYVFRDVRTNVAELAQAEAFDPNRRWGEQKGLLSRLAGGIAPGTGNKADSTTR